MNIERPTDRAFIGGTIALAATVLLVIGGDPARYRQWGRG